MPFGFQNHILENELLCLRVHGRLASGSELAWNQKSSEHYTRVRWFGMYLAISIYYTQRIQVGIYIHIALGTSPQNQVFVGY